MRNRRDRRDGNKLCLHVTNRLVEGLPLISARWMNFLLKGLIARAQDHYGVQVVAFLWMANHYHLIVCGRADKISPFKNYLHGELAKYLKRLMPGKYQSKVWAGRGNEQHLKTAEDVINKIVYLYTNPARANLVASITQYPGVSSWELFRTGSCAFEGSWVPPRALRPVTGRFSAKRDLVQLKELFAASARSGSRHTFTLKPFIWKRCFPESSSRSNDSIRAEILARIEDEEKKCAAARGQKQVLGAGELRTSPIDKPFKSKERSRTPFVQCHNPTLRKHYIADFKSFAAACRKTWQHWTKGIYSALFPAGAYRPGCPILFMIERPHSLSLTT